ncbi:MAG: DUF4838 domain-containing protein [Verrucomicrobia bacterium]|nr:DUF4838 domain-containing protein [Verrucomicrobiota bacterium]
MNLHSEIDMSALTKAGRAMILACTLSLLAQSAAAELTLAQEGASEYRIVISATASETEKRAASELQSFLKQISRAELPIIPDTEPRTTNEIILGNNRHLSGLGAPIEVPALGEEGFVIRTIGSQLVIAGGPVRGTLYGVYSFLEDYLGCHWLSSTVSVSPTKARVVVGAIDDIQVPVVGYREVYYSDAMEPRFAERNKLNGNASIIENGKMTRERHRGWGTWCHTFGVHVPAKKYFKEHPEYFALVDGKRRPDTQLCLTQPEVFRLVVADLKERMSKQPETRYWSVSQNDTGGYCQCPDCQAIDAREGTPMGSLLEFINRVAAEFPDKTISTLSYQYSRRPPKTLRPASNVLIMLCSIECDRRQSIAIEPSSASFRADVEGWSKISNNVFIWDYVVQFSHLVSPFPNLRVLQPDMQFFVRHHAKGVFAQGNREVQGEFAELRAYVLAKLMWNPACNVDRVIDEFLQGYYGPAAKPIRQYIDLMHDALEQSGAPLQIFGDPAKHRQGYLSSELLGRYNAFFDEAERLAANDRDVLLRVQAARIPLLYARLQLRIGDADTRHKDAQRLFSTAERVGLQMFNEWNLSTDRYRQQVMDGLQKEKQP